MYVWPQQALISSVNCVATPRIHGLRRSSDDTGAQHCEQRVAGSLTSQNIRRRKRRISK